MQGGTHEKSLEQKLLIELNNYHTRIKQRKIDMENNEKMKKLVSGIIFAMESTRQLDYDTMGRIMQSIMGTKEYEAVKEWSDIIEPVSF